MKYRSLTILGLLGLAFGLLASCQSPLATTQTSLSTGQTRIVVQTAAARALNLLDADYLTLQLSSNDGREVRFASADGGGTGTYSLVIDGLTSGDWNLNVRLYPSASSTSLLFYANLSHYVEAGRSNTLAIDLYPAGTIDGVSVTQGIAPLSLWVSDLEAGLWSTYGAHAVAVGQSLQLRAEARGAANVPATDQRVLWSSEDETILEVTSTGLITGVRPGTTTLKATTVAGQVSARYQVVVDLNLVGTWEADVETAQGLVVRKAMLDIQRTATGSLQATLWTGLDQGTTYQAHREEVGPLYAAGRSTYLFTRPQVSLNSHGADWADQPLINDSEPVVLQVLDADLLSFEGNNRSTGNSPVKWGFRRSALHIDSFDTPLGAGAVKTATVGQSLDLDLWGRDWDGYYSDAASNLLWSSSDVSVASVDPSSGQVNFLQPGTVSIRAHGTNAPDRVYKVTFAVQSAVEYAPLPAGSTDSGYGAFTSVAADTLSGTGGWLVAGQGHTTTALLTRYRANGAPDLGFGGNSTSLPPLAGLSQVGMVQAREGASTSRGFVQTDGQIHWLTSSLYGGANYSSNYRFGPSGALDTTYSDMVMSNQAFADFRATSAPVVDSLGNLYVLGTRTTDGVTVIKKLPASGVVDSETTTSNDFWVSPYTAAAFVGAQIQMAPDDKLLLVANNSAGANGQILKLTTAGTLDPGFGTSGIFEYENYGDSNRHYAALRVKGDRIYLTGSDYFYCDDPRYPWQYTGFVVRLTLAGAFDPAFAFGGNHGYYSNSAGPHFVLHKPYEVPLDLEVDAQGRVVVVGKSYGDKAFAVRLLPDGTGIDPTFGGSRQFGDGVILDQGTTSAALSVAIDAQNRIAVAGWLAQTSGYGYPDHPETYPALWRFE